MSFKFIHTSDWQIGKTFNYVDSEVLGLLKAARLSAIDRIGEHARSNDIGCVLVAGDVYDMEFPSERTLNQPLERMRRFEDVHWYLTPGNHDPHRPNGLWDRIAKAGLPANIHLLLESTPVELEDGRVWLLPAPLRHKSTQNDLTEYMNDCETPEHSIRIGIGHGSVVEFGSTPGTQSNYISPNRIHEANLSYLALGDWHGQKQISSRCWYSGTPEVDEFSVQNGGNALIVEIPAKDEEPIVTSVRTGQFYWDTFDESVFNKTDIDQLEKKLRMSDCSLSERLVHLNITGSLSLEDRTYFTDRIVNSVSAALCVLRVEQEGLSLTPSTEELDRIEASGIVREAMEKLRRIQETSTSSDEQSIAREALIRLYQEWRND